MAQPGTTGSIASICARMGARASRRIQASRSDRPLWDWLGRGPFKKFPQDRTESDSRPLNWPQQHATGNDEIFPPELRASFQSFRPKWFHLKTSAAQGFCGITHCVRVSAVTGVRRHLQNNHSKRPGFVCHWPSARTGAAGRPHPALHYLEREVSNRQPCGAWDRRHRWKQTACGYGKMSGRWDAPRSRLQAADSAESGRALESNRRRSLPTPPADRPAAIAAASPPLEPPGVRFQVQGLLVRP